MSVVVCPTLLLYDLACCVTNCVSSYQGKESDCWTMMLPKHSTTAATRSRLPRQWRWRWTALTDTADPRGQGRLQHFWSRRLQRGKIVMIRSPGLWLRLPLPSGRKARLTMWTTLCLPAPIPSSTVPTFMWVWWEWVTSGSETVTLGDPTARWHLLPTITITPLTQCWLRLVTLLLPLTAVHPPLLLLTTEGARRLHKHILSTGVEKTTGCGGLAVECLTNRPCVVRACYTSWTTRWPTPPVLQERTPNTAMAVPATITITRMMPSKRLLVKAIILLYILFVNHYSSIFSKLWKYTIWWYSTCLSLIDPRFICHLNDVTANCKD